MVGNSVISVSKYTNSHAYKHGQSAQYSACLYRNLISKGVFYQFPTILPYSLRNEVPRKQANSCTDRPRL